MKGPLWPSSLSACVFQGPSRISIDLCLQEFQTHILLKKRSQRPRKQSQVDHGNEADSQYRFSVVPCVVAEVECLIKTVLGGGFV